MALITDAANDWSTPVILTADEIWQTRKGRSLSPPPRLPPMTVWRCMSSMRCSSRPAHPTATARRG